MANLAKVQTIIKYRIPFDDNSGDKNSVYYDSDLYDITIKDTSSSVLVDKQNIDWLIAVLEDIKSKQT